MAEKNKQTDYQKAQELLPWYAKDKLPPEESNWVAKQLKNNSSLEEELILIKKQVSVTQNYINKLNTIDYENNPDRLSTLINRIHTQKNQRGNTDLSIDNKNKTQKTNLWTKLSSYLPKSQNTWQTAGALALGIIVIQGVVISQFYSSKADTEYTTLSEKEPTLTDDKIVLLTRLDLNATIYQVDALLNKYNLIITNGPDSGGIYQLTYIGEKLGEEAIEKMISDLEERDKVIRFIAREN